MKQLLFLLLSLYFLPSPLFGQYLTEHKPLTPFYSPSGRPRMAAEWEPAIGTLIAWPLSIPHKLVIELAKDNKLYTLVEDRKAQQEAINWFMKWGITPDKVKFIAAPQGVDVSWTRDWGPHALFAPDGMLRLADGKYLYATPMTGLECDAPLEHIYMDDQNKVILTETDDRIPEFIAGSLNLDIVRLPFAFTGGNVISDGQRTGFSTCALTNENRSTGVPDEKFFHDVKQLLGIENHHIVSNFETNGIQHIDCLMKLLDEERIMVMRPPVDHPSFAQYEGIVEHELRHLTNAYGRPYQILRIDTDRYHGDELAAYTNSLILNKNIYVPLFGIAQDSVALEQWRQAMPGYTVKGFSFKLKEEPVLSPQVFELYEEIGWKGSDALHCRTRAIWDPEMIYISVNRLPAEIVQSNEYPVDVIIKSYGEKGLYKENIRLMWRRTGDTAWKAQLLKPGEYPDHFTASLKGSHGDTLEYYVVAGNNSGKEETMPRTAPQGFYTTKVIRGKK